MGIYLKNMRMPKSCMDCPFKGFDRAGGRGNICTIDDSITLHAVLNGVDVSFVRMGDCPLVPVSPHGDLIDRDQFIEFIKTHWDSYDQWFIEQLEARPPIIPAEEE